MFSFYLSVCLANLGFWSCASVLSKSKYLLVFLLVFLESMLLIAEEEKKSIVREIQLANFDQAYINAVEKLIINYEESSGTYLIPGDLKKVALKVDTRSGLGLSTPANLIRALIIFLEKRGFNRDAILIIDYSTFSLKTSHIGTKSKFNLNSFEGCPIHLLDSNEFYEPDWFYESPIPPLLRDQTLIDVLPKNSLSYYNGSSYRKSFLPVPLLFEVDFWINLAVCVDHPVLGVGGVLENASLANVSNHKRFYANEASGAAAIAEILGIPEMNKSLVLHFVSLEHYQFIGGPKFNAYYSRSQPILRMSCDPVALDCLNLNLINFHRRKNGFVEIANPNLQLKYASGIGLGMSDLELIDIVTIENNPKQ